MNKLISLFIIVVFSGHSIISQDEPEKGNFSKYKVKSGVINLSGENSFGKTEYKIVFDEYGQKEFTEIEVTRMGTKEKTSLWKIDSLQYMIIKDRGFKTKRKKNFSIENIDLSKLQTNSGDYKISKIGEEVFLGRNCNKYEMKNERLNLVGEFLEWENIPLKIIYTSYGMRDSISTYRLAIDSLIDLKVFDVPQDIDFFDATMFNNN